MKAAVAATLDIAVPFQLQDDPDAATLGFLQYYAFMIAMVDRHILRVLEALDASGLRDDTLVVFASDHGEYGGSHSMMMEKWHSAYQEVIHVPVLFSHRRFNRSDTPVAIEAQTSHIDLLPTLLGLAGVDQRAREAIRRKLALSHRAAPLPGADLTAIVRHGGGAVIGPDGRERKAILFATDDMIAEPLPVDDDPHNDYSWKQFEVFCATIERLRSPPEGHDGHPYLPDLHPGPIVQPCHIRALRSGPWKLVRYCDPWSSKPVADEWELYQLDVDPAELTNLVVHSGDFPTVIAADSLPAGLDMSPQQVAETARRLQRELARLEAELLSPYPSAHPSAGAEIDQ